MTWRIILALVPAILHLALAHRGDEEQTKSADQMLSMETLPKGHLHSAPRRDSLVGSHDFHRRSPSSLLEEGQRVARNDTGSPPPSGDNKDLVLRIEYPYETFLNGDKPSVATNNSGAIHVTVTHKPDAATSAVPAVPAPGPTPPATNDNKMAWIGKDFAGLFKTVSYTVVRIQTIAAEVNWFEPYQQPQDMQLTGSGFAVSLEGVPEISNDPIFITNAHVVRDAHDVQLQLPAIGQQFFEAYVPLICDEFDLAVVQLVNPSEFFKALKEAGHGKLEQLPVVDYPLILGLEVASVGFPLGSTSLKLSRGVISGTEEVGDFICYQTTAPISPGSSGGPLFALDQGGELRVIGATFASAASRGAQNTNYVVPTVAIFQVLEQYKKQRELFMQSQASQGGVQLSLLQANPSTIPTSVAAAPVAPQVNSSTNQESGPAALVAPQVNASTDHNNVTPNNPEEDRNGKATDVASDRLSTAEAFPELEPAVDPTKSSGETIVRESHSGSSGQTETALTALRPTEVLMAATPEPVNICGEGRQQRPQRNKRLPHFQFRIAPIDAVGIEADKALFTTYGCKTGVFISKLLKTSVLAYANPPVKERTFLIEVDGVPIDEFGMGRTGAFLHDPTPFESLMMMKVKPGDSLTIKTCGLGNDQKEVAHTVRMEWDPAKYNVGIKNVVESFWDPDALEYELFSGITVMQLTVNHIIKLLRFGVPPTLGRWLLPENQEKKRLIITHVERGNYAGRVLAPGMVISKVNGREVGSLDEYRSAFEPPKGQKTWTLETDRGVLFATNFKESLEEQISRAEMGMTFMCCASVVKAARQMFMKPQAPPTANGTVGSLAETASNGGPTFIDTAERVSRLLKRQALIDSAGLEEEEEARRRARVAQSGFRILAASEYAPF